MSIVRVITLFVAVSLLSFGYSNLTTKLGYYAHLCHTNSSCSCTGEVVPADGISLPAQHPAWKILVSSSQAIEYVTSVGLICKITHENHGLPKNNIARSLTYDARQGLIYNPYNTSSATVISRIYLNDSTNFRGEILPHGHWSPRCVAFDWITGNLYYIQPDRGEIIACRNNSED